MNEVYLVDQTLRDGHQSLWATRMSTAMMLSIAPVIDQAGYQWADLMGAVQADAAVRYLRENPFERIRLMAKAMPNTPLGAWVRGKCIISFNILPDSVIALWIKRCAANGIRYMTFLEALCDWRNITESMRVTKKEGLKVAVTLVYSISPVHTDEYYVQKTAEAARLLKPDVFWLKDSMGLLTPERTRTLVPALLKSAGKIPLEFHSHCNTGLAPLCLLEAVRLGIKTVHTCVPPLANGLSHPSAQNTIRNLRLLGYTPKVDEKAIEGESAHFTWVAKRDDKPIGAPVEYDVFQHTRGMAGGTISNLKFMLGQRGMEDRWEEVVEEICLIGQEWGYPPNVTPYSQMMNAQAVLNVTLGERYSAVTEETARYVLGHYGIPPGPIDQNVIDKVSSLPEAKHLLTWEQPQPSLEDLRKEIGRPGISDDELALRAMFPQEHVDAMLAAGPLKKEYPGPEKPVVEMVEKLLKRRNAAYIRVEKEGFSLALRKQSCDTPVGKINLGLRHRS